MTNEQLSEQIADLRRKLDAKPGYQAVATLALGVGAVVLIVLWLALGKL